VQFGISESISHWAQYRSKDIALVYNDLEVSYWDLNSLIDSVCRQLEDHNDLNNDNRIGIAISPKLDFLAALIGVLRLGKSAVILNIGLPSKSIATNIHDTDVHIVITDNDDRIQNIETSWSINIIKFDPSLEEVLPVQRAKAQPHNEWGIFFSSGSTGTPKGIERDHNSVVTELLGWCLELNLNSFTNFYIGRPLYYTGGLVLSLSTLLVGGTVHLRDYINLNDATEVWHDFQHTLSKYSIDYAFFVPEQIRRFIGLIDPHGSHSISNVGTILTMGARITGDEKIMAHQLLKTEIIESWGNSESLGTITSPEDLRIRPNSIGRPFLTDELYIVDESGNHLSPGSIGRLAGNEESGFFRYSGRPGETQKVKVNELIISDDIGWMDEDGYFYIHGRVQDYIILDNETVFLPDIEADVCHHPLIQRCCVIPTQSNGSIELKALVVLSPDAQIETAVLVTEVNKMVDANVRLSHIKLVNNLPLLPAGKVDKLAALHLLNADD
jgi:acyl-coenzyme A synthetase/AMP-(fatty) acid ligase